MKTFEVTFDVDTDLVEEFEVERVVRKALDKMEYRPFIDYHDLEIVLIEDDLEGEE